MTPDNKKKLEEHPANKGNEDAHQPDPETLGTTDPQEHMKGPVSSFIQKLKGGVEKIGGERTEKTEEEEAKHRNEK